MPENKQYHLSQLENINYGFNYHLGLSFMYPSQYTRVDESISFLRRNKEINGHEAHIIRFMLKHQVDNYYKIKDYEYNHPRRLAQLFIGKKKIRKFIFTRDKHKCLKCGSVKNLQIDHIIPVSKGGENKLSNLQTLCASCNSKKRDTYKDYR